MKEPSFSPCFSPSNFPRPTTAHSQTEISFSFFNRGTTLCLSRCLISFLLWGKKNPHRLCITRNRAKSDAFFVVFPFVFILLTSLWTDEKKQTTLLFFKWRSKCLLFVRVDSGAKEMNSFRSPPLGGATGAAYGARLFFF